MRLTQYIHEEILSSRNIAFSIAVDATAGNGHDTLFLASHFQTVYAFDIQSDALLSTKEKLESHGIVAQFIQDSHENMFAHIPKESISSIGLVMFNLGYLPNFNKSITTLAHSTIVALDRCIEHLSNGALISIIAYPGHPEGTIELAAIQSWMQSQSTRLKCLLSKRGHSSNSPVAFLLRLGS